MCTIFFKMTSKEQKEKLLHQMKTNIDMLAKEHQIDVLHLLLKNNCDVSENQNGNFVNLTMLNDSVLSEIKEYLDYVEFQNESLKEIERKKELLVNKYFLQSQSSKGCNTTVS